MGIFWDKYVIIIKSFCLDNVVVMENGLLGEFKWEYVMLLLLFYLLEDISIYMWILLFFNYKIK